MTIEEQMYDEIMHKMPHRIAELVKTIDTIHKMLEAKHLGALSDNLDQLKKTLAQTEQKYNDLYESFYQTGNFHDILLPKSYSEIEDSFVNSGYIEDRINEQADYYRNEDGEVDVSKLDYDPYDEHEAGQFDLYDNFLEVSQNDDFKDFCKYYYKDGYDIEESGTFEDNYIDGNGNFDFEKFCEETDFKHDMMQPISGSILLGDKVREALEQAKEAWAEPTKEEQAQTQEKVKPSERKYHPFDTWHDDNFHILYTNGDGNHINEIKYVNGGPVGTLDVKALNLKAGTPKEKLEQIAKNIIASTKTKDPIIKPEPIKQNNDFER